MKIIIINNMRDYADLFNEQLEKQQYKPAQKTLDALIKNATACRTALFPANAGHQTGNLNIH
jgi:hypothetical protein